MKKYFSSIIFLSILLISFNSSANFTIMPVKLEINKNNKVATMTLQNNDYITKNFQLVLLKREYKDGREEYIETKDLVATPVMFTLQGTKMQLIRIAVKNQNYSKGENAYRIAVKELPHRIKLDNGITSTVNFVVEFNVPITISG